MTSDEAKSHRNPPECLEQRLVVVVLTALPTAEVAPLETESSSILAPWALQSPPSTLRKLSGDQPDFTEPLLCLGQH